jgi:hypothetical protein
MAKSKFTLVSAMYTKVSALYFSSSFVFVGQLKYFPRTFKIQRQDINKVKTEGKKKLAVKPTKKDSRDTTQLKLIYIVNCKCEDVLKSTRLLVCCNNETTQRNYPVFFICTYLYIYKYM